MKIGITYRKVGRGAAVPNYCLELARRLARTDETWLFTTRAERLPPSVDVCYFPLSFRSKRLEYGPNTLLNRLLIGAVRIREKIGILHTQDGDMVGSDVVTAHALLRVVYRTLRTTDPQYVEWLARSPLLWFEDIIYGTHRYRHIITASEKTRSALQSEYGVRGEDVTVIPLGIEPNLLKPSTAVRQSFREAHNLSDEARVLMHVSTDFERKGLRQILRSLAMLPRDYSLVVVGAGASGPYLELAGQLGLRERVLFIGYRPDLEAVLPAADMFVFPTRLDFFGYPVLEAMACGVPPLVTATAGVAELIEDGKNGLLLEDPADEQELAALLMSYLDGGHDSRKMGRAARETAERISLDKMAEETRTVYEHLQRR